MRPVKVQPEGKCPSYILREDAGVDRIKPDLASSLREELSQLRRDYDQLGHRLAQLEAELEYLRD
jgi:hypothetical protein